MPQSPELAGGEGFTFEGNVAAYYMAALLAETYAPGIADRVVTRVAVQQRDFGDPLDDVIIDFDSSTGGPARLSLQVKRSLTISAAASNADFRGIVADSWATLSNPDFRSEVDRYGAAVGTVAPAKARALQTLAEDARESDTVAHFEGRFSAHGNAAPEVAIVRAAIEALLAEVTGAPVTAGDLLRFLRHFVFIEFDFLHEGATEPATAMGWIRDSLATDAAAQAPTVWDRIVRLARASAGKAGVFDRRRLVRAIAPVARLKGAPSLRGDLERLGELARSYAASIPDDVGTFRLGREALAQTLDQALSSARIVQIRGMPGSGKSVLLRGAVETALAAGPVLFLKGDQLQGTNWRSFATAHGLSVAALPELLVEIGGAGTAILFVDAIDRAEKEHQPIILDVLRAIADTPHLDNWRVVLSLRSTGIEPIRNWMGALIDAAGVATVDVDTLDDDEAEALARAKPHLRPLLFGDLRVQEIVRRPFFAKILDQSFTAPATSAGFAPRSEVDLIEDWWARGGYDASGQNAFDRQRAIVALGTIRSRNLSRPISLGGLDPASRAQIAGLIADGILQEVRVGHTVRFAHDIFFEWAFFHVLTDQDDAWIEEIRSCGEPPAVARVVELLSQSEYGRQQEWPAHLERIAGAGMRSQWTRAWLLGPIGGADFESDEDQFEHVALADDAYYLRKTLVWFQAEKTTPNTNILAGKFTAEQRVRYADMLGWPSDPVAWMRLIAFLLRRVERIPVTLYPDIAVIFEVWQNAVGQVRNPTSSALLRQCAAWLDEIAMRADAKDGDPAPRWKDLEELKEFRTTLEGLVLRASGAEPTLAAALLDLTLKADRIRDDRYEGLLPYAFPLSTTHPAQLVDITLKVLKEELPDARRARERREAERARRRREEALAKAPGERTRHDELAIQGIFSRIGSRGYDHDWRGLFLDRGTRSFYPASPLRQPFLSLFQNAPDEALRLLRDLCNHAVAGWRQLYKHDPEARGEPLALDIVFPWGTQRFWGDDRVYLWCRSPLAPLPIACGFMALEEWCFRELESGCDPDALIRQIVEGHDSIAILGVTAMIASHTETLSETVFSLVTSQRLLNADNGRLRSDFGSRFSSLIGLEEEKYQADRVAIVAANERPIRQKQLSGLIPRFFLFGGEAFSDRIRDAVNRFAGELPYLFAEHRDLPAAREYLGKLAREYAELVDRQNYTAYATDEPDKVAVIHESPSAAEPEQVQKREKARLDLEEGSIWIWAAKSFEAGALQDNFPVQRAIELARAIDHPGLFGPVDGQDLSQKRGAVAAVAAVLLQFRDGVGEAHLVWGRDVIARAAAAPEQRDLMWSSMAEIPWHHGVFAVRGLRAEIRAGTAGTDAAITLLRLAAHPLDIVSRAAIGAAFGLTDIDPKLGWIALVLGVSLCDLGSRADRPMSGPYEPTHAEEVARHRAEVAIGQYRADGSWPAPLTPPPPWRKVSKADAARLRYVPIDDDVDGETGDDDMVWAESNHLFDWQYAAKILSTIPARSMLEGDTRSAFLAFISGLLDWTVQSLAPPWADAGRRDRDATRMYEWTHAFGSFLGKLAGMLPAADVADRFLKPICALEGDACWELLAPLADTLICASVYDAPAVPGDIGQTLDRILDRLLAAPELDPAAYRAGRFSGFDLPNLVKSMMFVSIDQDCPGAARFVNGDWSEIALILPIVDRYVRDAGWDSTVMSQFLKLSERAKAHYPTDAFADQILSIVEGKSSQLKGWRGSSLPARIAGLVQALSDRDTPLALPLAQKLLRILDLLIDMGDRRSAALQFGETFREVRLTG